MFQRRNCTWKTMAESRLPRLQPRMMATSRMETLVVREEEDVESAREEYMPRKSVSEPPPRQYREEKSKYSAGRL